MGLKQKRKGEKQLSRREPGRVAEGEHPRTGESGCRAPEAGWPQGMQEEHREDVVGANPAMEKVILDRCSNGVSVKQKFLFG